MADMSSPGNPSDTYVLSDSDIQPHLVGGALHFHDSSDDIPGGMVNPAFSESSTDPLPTNTNNTTIEYHNVSFQNNNNGQAAGLKLPPPPTKKDIIDQNKATSPQSTERATTHANGTSLPVVYDNRSGNNVVIQEPVVANQTDGSQAIQTRAIPERWRELDRPLRQKRLKFLKVFGIIAIFFFFPTGFPACYYAFKAKDEFEIGIMKGDIELAAKYAKRAERLIILSGVLALVVGILAFALFERSMNPERYVNWHPSAGIVPGS